jgi:hypothetical protein
VVLALTACGGGQQAGSPVPVDASKNSAELTSFQATSNTLPSDETVALQIEGARLNSLELAQIAETGELSEPYEGLLISGVAASEIAASGVAKSATKVAVSAVALLPVYRFFNTRTSAHFFTSNTTERDAVIAKLPHLSYEGTAFYAYGSAATGLSPVHRFYNVATGVHFYTISEAERALVAANLPQFNYEGIAYYASTRSGTGFTPLYRFFYAAKGFHFYTRSEQERATISATLPHYSFEGVGYYVPSNGDDLASGGVPAAGSYKPSITTTGANNLYTATPAALVPGEGMTIRVDGTVIENVTLTGPITVEADNVTIRNFKINTTSFYGINASKGAKNLLIEDGEIQNATSSGLYGGNLIARRLYIHNVGADAIKLTENATVETSFITDVGFVDGAHADGIQMVAGSNVLVQGNNFHMPYNDPDYINSQVMILQTNNAAVDNIQMVNNWFNGGGYSIQIRERNYGTPTNMKLINNRFGRDFQFGPWIIDGDGTELSGNVWEDTGALIAGQDPL